MQKRPKMKITPLSQAHTDLVRHGFATLHDSAKQALKFS